MPWLQGGEDDLDALLAQFKLEEGTRNQVTIQQQSEPPSPRLFASMTAVSGQVSSIRLVICRQSAATTALPRVLGVYIHVLCYCQHLCSLMPVFWAYESSGLCIG